jgi:hypothetical protein
MMNVPRFTYIVGIKKNGDDIKAVSFNCPYDDIVKVKDDLEVMIKGKDFRGNDLKEYKIINLENEIDGFYWAKVLVRYVPNGDNSFDQIFELKDLIKGERNCNPFKENQ